MISASNATDAAITAAFAKIPALLDQTPALIARGRLLDCECLLGPINHALHQLTTARYTQTIRAFCKALKLDRPVVMGCSIRGRIVLNLAIDHAAEFRALIGLEGADFQAPWYDSHG